MLWEYELGVQVLLTWSFETYSSVVEQKTFNLLARGSNPLMFNVSRSKWKPVLNYCFRENSKDSEVSHRAQIISPSDVNKTLVIENGIASKAIKITVDHVGHKAGEFLQTKKRVVFKNKK